MQQRNQSGDLNSKSQSVTSACVAPALDVVFFKAKFAAEHISLTLLTHLFTSIFDSALLNAVQDRVRHALL